MPFDAVVVPNSRSVQFISRDSSKPGRRKAATATATATAGAAGAGAGAGEAGQGTGNADCDYDCWVVQVLAQRALVDRAVD